MSYIYYYAIKNTIQAIQISVFCMHSVDVNGSPNTMGDQANIISHNAMEFFIAFQPWKQPPFQDIWITGQTQLSLYKDVYYRSYYDLYINS